MKNLFLSLTFLALILSSCGGSTTTENTSSERKTETAATPGKISVTINGGDDMKFDLSEIKVKEGQIVTLTLNHTGKMTKDVMGHNFIVLTAGTDLNAFAMAAIAAKDNDYIPVDMQGSVIAHTQTIGGGETTQIEFTAPAKGTYDFLCSFPGHFAMMKGKFIVA